MVQQHALIVNGIRHTVSVSDPNMPLLYVLRDELAMNNPKFGCGLGQCGACTVHVDGTPARSCITPFSMVGDKPVTTMEGIGTEEKPHPLQAAWVAEEVSQCGYCMNGFIMEAVALLEETPQPTGQQIRERLGGVKCRCGTHLAAIRAVERASQIIAGVR